MGDWHGAPGRPHYVKVTGRWVYLYRAIDQFGQVIDVLVSEKRDLAATRRFFSQALGTTTLTSVEVSTDQAAAYPHVLEELAPGAWHHTEPYANNRIEAGAEHPPRPLRTRGRATADLRVLAAFTELTQAI